MGLVDRPTGYYLELLFTEAKLQCFLGVWTSQDRVDFCMTVVILS